MLLSLLNGRNMKRARSTGAKENKRATNKYSKHVFRFGENSVLEM
jgi:hypothetical protein